MRRLTPTNRGGIWYLVRRVPRAFQHVDKRRFVKISTGVYVADDPRGAHAGRILPQINEQLEQEWRDLDAGLEPDHNGRYERARRRARSFGFEYRPANDLVAGPLHEVRRRLDMIRLSGLMDDEKVVEAILGGVERPPLMLSGLLDAFEEEQSASLTDLSPRQRQRWRTHKERPLRTFIEVVGDKSVGELTRADGLAFRRYLQDRIIAGELEISTANKEIGGITRMLRVIEDARQLGIPLAAYSKLRIEGGKEKQRAAFDPVFIQNVILAEGAFDGISEEARRVVYVCADSGLRPVEVVNLTPECIHLSAPVPYVQVKAIDRRLKTDQSERDIPLVGCALAAMRLQPKGFPTYRDKSDGLSAHVNAVMKRRGMRPTKNHTLYSLRHSFEDRLTALDPPDKIVATLMGHKFARPKYGAGPTLKHLQGWLQRIAFTPPKSP